MIEIEKFTAADYIRAAFIGIIIASIPSLFLQVYDLNTRIGSLNNELSKVDNQLAQNQEYINALAEEIGKSYCFSKGGSFGYDWGDEFCTVKGVMYTRSGMDWVTGDSVKTL